VNVSSKTGVKIRERGLAITTHARNHVFYLPRGERLSALDILLSQSGWGMHCMANPTENDADNNMQSLGVIVHENRQQECLISGSMGKIWRLELLLEHYSYMNVQARRLLHPEPNPSHVGAQRA
jgi:hypothetical protein